MTITIILEIDIDKPLQEVMRFIFEPTNEPYWIAGVQESHMLSVRPIGRGSQVQRLLESDGIASEWIYEVTEFEPEGRMKLISLSGDIPIEISYRLEKLDDHTTRFKYTMGKKPAGIKAIVEYIKRSSERRNMIRNLHRLKDILESA